MILRRPTLNPLCRQCGHELDRPLSRCPMCGMRTGLVPPLRVSARPAIAEGDVALRKNDYEELSEIDSEEEELVLAPPLERPPQTPLSLDAVVDEEPQCELDDAPAPSRGASRWAA